MLRKNGSCYWLSLLLVLGLLGSVSAAEPEKADALRPKLVKLPFAFPEGMENTPVVFNGRVLLVANQRPGGYEAKGVDAWLTITDLTTGQLVTRFGQGHSFVSAIVNGPELHVFATEFTDFGRATHTKCINHFVTTDLKTWKQETVLDRDGKEEFFNTSVCRDEQGYVMAYESNVPVSFCFKFARSQDLSHWEKVPGVTYAGPSGREYSACPVIRYVAPYYYVIFLHEAGAGQKAWVSYLIRSRDLATWELSPLNPILRAEPGEGVNTSDVDLLELGGHTYLYYATGDQETWGTIRVAMYAGPMKELLESFFPAGQPTTTVSAKRP